MSVHRSLVPKTTLARGRNVWSRAERLKVLSKEGRWSDGESVFGLPKVRTSFAKKAGKKKKEKKAEEGAKAEGAKS